MKESLLAWHLSLVVAVLMLLQSVTVGRPSLLLLKAKEEAGSYEILVGGNVQMVAKGEFV